METNNNKMEFKVLLNMVNSAVDFVRLAEVFNCDVMVHSCNRKYRVDGTSVMGVLSLDLSLPVIVSVNDDASGQAFKEAVIKYVVD